MIVIAVPNAVAPGAKMPAESERRGERQSEEHKTTEKHRYRVVF